jgi:hypothetical protein
MGTQLIGPIFALNTADRVLQEGDSISALDTSTQMPMLVKRRLFQLAQQTPNGPKPCWLNSAISSTDAPAQLVRLQAGIAKFKPTKVIWIFGTAPLLLGNPIGTVNDQVTSTILGCYNLAMTMFRQMGVPVYVGSIACLGEKWPTGANASDTSIDSLIAGLAVISARFTDICTFRDLRSTFYAVQEPIVNVANTTMGPFMRPDASGVHHNPGGRGASDNVIANDFTITAASAPNTALVPYGGVTPPTPGSLGLAFDPANAGVAIAANVSSLINSGLISGANMVTVSGTPPTLQNPAAGKNGNLPLLRFGGSSWLRTAAFTARPQPHITAFVWLSTNITANQIMYDGTTGIQEGYLATLATTGIVEYDSGVAVDGPAIVAGKWNSAIVYFAGNNSGSYLVLNGAMQPLANEGNIWTRTQLTIGAAANNGLPATIDVGGFYEWHSSLGALPKWWDVQGFLQAKHGLGAPFPQ